MGVLTDDTLFLSPDQESVKQQYRKITWLKVEGLMDWPVKLGRGGGDVLESRGHNNGNKNISKTP